MGDSTDSRISVLTGLSLRISIDERADHALVRHLLLLHLALEEIDALWPCSPLQRQNCAQKQRRK